MESEIFIEVPEMSSLTPPRAGHHGEKIVAPALFRPGVNPSPGERFFMIEAGTGAGPWDTVELVIELRQEVSPNAAILVADADLWSFPLLALAGVDLLGDSHARSSATAGRMLFDSYSIEAGNPGRGACNCPVCSDTGFGSDPSMHNRWAMDMVLTEIRNRIDLEEIKLMAEERSVGHPEVNAALKRTYAKYGEYLERHTTVTPGVRS
jgi:predicted RNA-binding protein